MIDTNQVRFNFDHDAIAQDFVIFEAKRDSGNYNHSKVPDVALQQCQALAVAYDRGSSCYILYRRSFAEKNSLKQMLESYEGNIRVREVTSRQLAEKQSYRLAQLLCNAIPSLGMDCELYHNVTGKLYYLERGWTRYKKDQLASFWTLQISFTWEGCIKLEVQTFSNVQFKKNVQDKPQYLLDQTNFLPRRVLKEERNNSAPRFVMAAWSPNYKNTVPFLEFGSLTEYRKCKVGILQRFLRDVQTLLSPYLSLEMVALDESCHIGDKHNDSSMSGIRQRLKQKPLYLKDAVCSEQSANLVSLVRQELDQYSSITPADGEPPEGAALIRIIHSKEYCEINEEPDVYADAPKNVAVQHVTVEDFSLDGAKEDPGLRKIIQELAIKLDVYEGRMSCYNWANLNFPNPVTFVMAKKADKSKPVCYQRLRVMPDGILRFDTWEEPNCWTSQEEEKIAKAFENDKGWFDRQVEGLVCEDIEHIHVIRRTDRYTLPAMEELESRLSATREDEPLSVEVIVAAIQNGLDRFTDLEQERCSAMIDAIREYGKQISRKELNNIFNMRSGLGKKLNDMIMEETGIMVNARLKQKQLRDLIFGGTLDIRHFCEGKTQYYYSGYSDKSLKWTLPHACRIRKVTSMGELLQFERYLPLLEVDFVRANGWTVIPFPFKYLREWGKLQQVAQKM